MSDWQFVGSGSQGSALSQLRSGASAIRIERAKTMEEHCNGTEKPKSMFQNGIFLSPCLENKNYISEEKEHC
jgi:hypothetical protein